jgi:hypothetical protein
MNLVVHRATRQIGGNCIELASGGSWLVLDVGRPLYATPPPVTMRSWTPAFSLARKHARPSDPRSVA